MAEKRLVRSTDDRIFLGVLGGLAAYMKVDPTLVRALFVLLSVFSTGFPGLLLYIILAIVMPEGATLSGQVHDFGDNGYTKEQEEIKIGS